MKQTFGIVDNGKVRDMTPEEIEYYCSLDEPEEETNNEPPSPPSHRPRDTSRHWPCQR